MQESGKYPDITRRCRLVSTASVPDASDNVVSTCCPPVLCWRKFKDCCRRRTKIKARVETAYGEWVERIPAWTKWANAGATAEAVAMHFSGCILQATAVLPRVSPAAHAEPFDAGPLVIARCHPGCSCSVNLGIAMLSYSVPSPGVE